MTDYPQDFRPETCETCGRESLSTEHPCRFERACSCWRGIPCELWAAGWNMPGYLPETDPETFATLADAVSYLQETLDRFADEDELYDADVPVFDVGRMAPTPGMSPPLRLAAYTSGRCAHEMPSILPRSRSSHHPAGPAVRAHGRPCRPAWTCYRSGCRVRRSRGAGGAHDARPSGYELPILRS